MDRDSVFPDLLPLSPDVDNFNIADIITDDWLGSAVNSTADFHDDPIAATLAAFSHKDDPLLGDTDFQGLMPDRHAGRTPSMMRASFSMNDLTALQHQQVSVPSWNHKLVSVKPKLQSVPEGGPSNGGPLNLMPLPMGAPPNGMQLQQHPAHHILGLDSDLEDFADLDSDGPGGMHKQMSSTGSLAQKLQMTHVHSDMEPLDHMQAQNGNHLYHPNGFMGHHEQEQGVDGGDAHAGTDQVPLRRPSGLPLRKSQSAVELGSWRSFSVGDDFFDLDAPGENGKPWKLTAEERLQRIQRYREKRLQRNLARPSVKYQCRKTVADARLRVRGRFARSDADMSTGMPLDSKKSQSTDPSSSGGHTSSGGAAATSMMHSFGNQQVANSMPSYYPPSAGRAASMPAPNQVPTSMQGISMIGATPMPMLQPELAAGGVPCMVPMSSAAQGSAHMPGLQGMQGNMLPNSFPPMPPPYMGPSGGIFTGGKQYGTQFNGVTGAGSSNSSMMNLMPPIPPIPYMSGQTIFTGQSIFSGGNAAAGPAHGQFPSASASAHPSMSPPLLASPAVSDSHSQSIGLSIGDFSTGHSL